MTTYGLTAFGFWRKPLERIVVELEEDLRAVLGAELNTKSGPVHQIIGTFASPLAEQWELLEQAAAAIDRNAAGGALLDALGTLTGTLREAATPSTVTLTLTLSGATTVPAGSVVSRAGDPTIRFVTLADVVVGAAGTETVAAEGESAGPFEAPAGTLTVIETPVSGWASVTNALDATLGTDEESDETYRARQVAELEASGAGTIDTIRARVLRVDGVIDCLAYENRTDVTDGDGRPPYSFEVVIWDGVGTDADDQEIANVIWATQPATGRSYGTTSQAVTDEAGGAQAVRFSRVTKQNAYLEIQLDASTAAGWDAGYEALIKSALATWGDVNLGVGDDVIRSRFYEVIHAVSPSIVNVTAILTGWTASPLTAADLTVGVREVADLDTSRIVVTTTVVP
jgi:uncharacterized phage protein gp47/JayE